MMMAMHANLFAQQALLTAPQPRTLTNEGNKCFRNAVLQLLAAITGPLDTRGIPPTPAGMAVHQVELVLNQLQQPAQFPASALLSDQYIRASGAPFGRLLSLTQRMQLQQDATEYLLGVCGFCSGWMRGEERKKEKHGTGSPRTPIGSDMPALCMQQECVPICSL